MSWKGGESKGQEKKDKHKKRRAQGQKKTVDADFKEEEVHIPKDKVGLILGKKGWKKMDIISRSGIQDLVIKEDLVYITGTEEQRTRAKQIIEKVLRVSFTFIFTPLMLLFIVLFVLCHSPNFL